MLPTDLFQGFLLSYCSQSSDVRWLTFSSLHLAAINWIAILITVAPCLESELALYTIMTGETMRAVVFDSVFKIKADSIPKVYAVDQLLSFHQIVQSLMRRRSTCISGIIL